MTNDSMERYVKFISQELELIKDDKLQDKKIRVNLPRLEPNDKGGYDRLYVKMGLSPNISVMVKPLGVYSRSIKLLLKFDKYEIETIYFMSRHKSPDELIGMFNRKISDIVEKTLLDDNRHEDIIKLYNERKFKIESTLKSALETIKNK